MDSKVTAGDTLISEVLNAEVSLCRAFSENDWETVALYLGEEFTHTHSGGYTEGKDAWIAHCSAKRRTMTRSDLKVLLYGEVAVITGGLRMDTEPQPGKETPPPLTAMALQAWVRRDGEWKMVASQNTKLPVQQGNGAP